MARCRPRLAFVTRLRLLSSGVRRGLPSFRIVLRRLRPCFSAAFTTIPRHLLCFFYQHRATPPLLFSPSRYSPPILLPLCSPLSYFFSCFRYWLNFSTTLQFSTASTVLFLSLNTKTFDFLVRDGNKKGTTNERGMTELRLASSCCGVRGERDLTVDVSLRRSKLDERYNTNSLVQDWKHCSTIKAKK